MPLAPVRAEQTLVTYLTAALTLPVGTRVPTPRPAQFVKVTRTGGDQRNLIQSDVVVLVEAWGTTETLAWDATERAWRAFDVARTTGISGLILARVRLTEPVNFPDSASGSPRYQFLVTLTVNLRET